MAAVLQAARLAAASVLQHCDGCLKFLALP
jgi:hypothetical protein